MALWLCLGTSGCLHLGMASRIPGVPSEHICIMHRQGLLQTKWVRILVLDLKPLCSRSTPGVSQKFEKLSVYLLRLGTVKFMSGLDVHGQVGPLLTPHCPDWPAGGAQGEAAPKICS